MIQDQGRRINHLIQILDEKLDRNAIEALICDKIGKEELAEILPNMEAYDIKMQSRIDETQEELWRRLEEKLVSWDKRIVNVRQEFDVDVLYKTIDGKANHDIVAENLKNQENKIQTLDRNILAIATDFETFQLAINRMHTIVMELKEAN